MISIENQTMRKRQIRSANQTPASFLEDLKKNYGECLVSSL